ncbi:hypothetical protein T08_1461 [Trichinella sp. T8]|nr:hypothetical protein T08_1461 [Trichinella sp. T8]
MIKYLWIGLHFATDFPSQQEEGPKRSKFSSCFPIDCLKLCSHFMIMISCNISQLTVIAAWRLPCKLHNADRSAMTHLAFRRDIAAHLLLGRPLQILRPKRNDICQAVCEAHVDISCSQERRITLDLI